MHLLGTSVCDRRTDVALYNNNNNNNNNIAKMAVFSVAGYLIEERRRWPVITASPRRQYSK